MGGESDAAEVGCARAELARLGILLLQATGASPDGAEIVVEHLLDADAMGLRSHGIIRLPQYLAEIARGEIDPAASPEFRALAPGRSACDGRWAFGQVAGTAMATEAIRLARENGVAFVTGKHMGHTGRIGAYPEMIAGAGLVGITVCSGPRSGHFVAPFGGREGRLATNPIAYAVPLADRPPVVADFSTSVVPEGVVRSLMHRGLPVPAGALRDPAGMPTTDPAVLYADPRGSLQPLGGPMGYRGTALAMLVEVLAALLAGDDTDDLRRTGSNLGMLAIVTDPSFGERAARMARYLRSAPPVDTGRPVILPGEREQALAAAGRDIAVDGPTWRSLTELAGRHGIAMPEGHPHA